MPRTKYRAALVAALLALLVAAVPATASASHDPSPPWLSSSLPGGHAAYGYHHKDTSATTDCWAFIQRNGGTVDHRAEWKCQGDGRVVSVQFRYLTFWDNDIDYRACWSKPCSKSGSVVRYVGAWHPVTTFGQITGEVLLRYATGASSGWQKINSYVIKRGQRAAVGPPGDGG